VKKETGRKRETEREREREKERERERRKSRKMNGPSILFDGNLALCFDGLPLFL